MARIRPTPVTVMGILNIVFGSLSLLCLVCVGFGLVVALNTDFLERQGQINHLKDNWEFMQREVPAYLLITVVNLGSWFVLGLLLLIAGIGLLCVSSWARMLSIVTGLAMLLTRLGWIIFTLAVVNPVGERWQGDFLRRHPGVVLERSPILEFLVYAILGINIIYSIVLLVMMLTPTVSAAFAGAGPPSEYEAGGGADEGDDFERRRQRDGWND
ncbi:MAG TPA: hypothetical protein VEL76_23710 [Gemmataceae bacterium]|nr:hypothetical protein [Gemmataceae bacterium]